jgi:hypothetical protein
VFQIKSDIESLPVFLKRTRRAYRKKELIKEACLIAVFLLGWTLLWHLADVAFILTPVFRIIVSLITAALFTCGIGRLSCLAFKPVSPARMAEILEAGFPGLRQEVSTALQWQGGIAAAENYSPDMIRALESRVTERLQTLDLVKTFPSPSRRVKVSLIVLAAIHSLLIIFTFSSVKLTGQRYLFPFSACGNWPADDVTPGNDRISEGQDLEVRLLKTTGENRAYLWVKIGKGWSRKPFYDQVGFYMNASVAAESSFSYRVFSGRRQSPEFRVEVYHPLILSDLVLKLAYPAYTGIPEYRQQNDGNVAAVKGTRVTLTAKANQPLQKAGLVFSGGKLLPGVTGGGCEMRVEFSVTGNSQYRIWAMSGGDDTLMNQAQYDVAILDDAPPTVKITSPQDGAQFSGDAPVSVEVAAADDYGLGRVELHLTDPLHKYLLPCILPGRGPSDTVLSFSWQPSGNYLLPGDSVLCWAEAWDDDRVSGPKHAKSEVIRLVVPSREEIYRRQAASDSADNRELDQARQQQSSLKQEMERLGQALKENRQLDWQQKAAVEEALKNQEQLVQKMEQAARDARQQMADDTREVKFDLQTVKKLAELRDLFDQVATEEMRRSMEQMQQALQKMDRRELEKALEEFKLSQEEFQQRLDAAIASLKELQQEQMLSSLKQEVDEMVRQQKSIKDAVAREKQGTPEQARRQKQLAEDLESVQKRAEELSGQMQERNPQAANMVRQAGQKSRQQQTEQKMRRAGQKMESGDNGGVQALQQEALVDLTELSAGLQGARNNMGSQRSKEASKAMRRKAAELVDLSRQQEDLNQRMGEASSDVRDLAARQQALQRQAARIKQKLDEMTRKNFMFSPQAGQSLQEAIRQMGSSGQSLSESRRAQASGDGRSAQSSLNQAAVALIQSSSQSGGGSGSGNMMQDLEGLTGMQQNINQGSQGLMPVPGGEQGLSQQARSQMARLAAEQEAVRQGMESFDREYGQRGDRSGRLDDLVSEMEKVISDLKNNKVDRQTIERQEKILSRMLSAGSSLQEQETSQQRQAEPGKEDLSSGSRSRPNAGQPDWRRAPELKNWRNQPYPLEYRELLEEYFRLLGQ